MVNIKNVSRAYIFSDPQHSFGNDLCAVDVVCSGLELNDIMPTHAK
jgi:hypothetical protein